MTDLVPSLQAQIIQKMILILALRKHRLATGQEKTRRRNLEDLEDKMADCFLVN